MAQDLYLYSPIYDFVAESLMQQMDEQGDNTDICMRINSGGGDVFAGYGIMAKIAERTGKTKMKVDGNAMSMSAMLLCFASEAECLDVSTIMLHRASMNVSSPEDQAFLDGVNSKLREKLTSKIDDKKLKELKGVNIKNLFEDEKRIDLFLTAKEAKKIGLVSKINVLTPVELKAFNDKMYRPAANHNPEPNPKITMTKEQFKSEHRAIYDAIVAEAKQEAKAEELDRIQACLEFMEIDPVGVKAAIESGKNLSQAQISAFTLKAIAKQSITAIKKDANGNVITEEPSGDDKDKNPELAAFEAQARKALGLK